VTTARPHLERLKVGVVGAGFMAQVHSVAASASGASLDGVVPSSAARSNDAAARLGLPIFQDRRRRRAGHESSAGLGANEPVGADRRPAC
jgi:threonine dehydrogenase-like Zn-dependent dehydrogenase